MGSIKQFQQLGGIRQTLAQQQAQKLQREQAEREQQAQRERERNVFRASIGVVKPLNATQRVVTTNTCAKPEPLPKQRLQDDKAVLQESLSDDWDVESLLETDAALSYRAAGIGTDVLRKLRNSQWKVQAELDLHGLRVDAARAALTQFMHGAVQQGLRCVRVVHGKGLGSPGKTPVLKSKVLSWLVQKKAVIAYVQARPAEGGAGALMVLLQAQ